MRRPAPARRGSGPSAFSVLLQGRVAEVPHRRVVVRDALDVLGLDQRGLVPQPRHRRREGRDVVVDLGERLAAAAARGQQGGLVDRRDRKSTRLNSSHVEISYAVFCLKKKKEYN